LISGWTPLPFEIPTSIVTPTFSKTIKLYPNPVKDQFLNIEGAEGGESISIFDMTGRMVFSEKLEDTGNQKINLNNKVQQGSYIVKITGGAGTSSQLLVVE